jgi:EAL and modified HD-GYP domain-containing signal transduction protein
LRWRRAEARPAAAERQQLTFPGTSSRPVVGAGAGCRPSTSKGPKGLFVQVVIGLCRSFGQEIPLMTAIQNESHQGPTRVHSPAPMRTSVVRLLSLLRNNAEIATVEEEFRRDPVLAYKLLRFVNSAAGGFAKEITSFRQAITVMGYQQLHRWMVVMLVAADERPGRSEMVKAALVRGRFMELVGESHLRDSGAQDMFMVGVLSRVDEILGVPMEYALSQVKVADEVRAALLRREGFYGRVLKLAEALEVVDEVAVDTWISTNVIDLQLLCDSYGEATDWVALLPV